MDVKNIIHSLELNYNVFTALFKSLPEDLIKWKPAPDKWSLLEIVNHLYDEERFDFRDRCGNILEQKSSWNPISSDEWVISRKYEQQDYVESVNNFLKERTASIEWLNKNKDSDWNISVEHKRLGTISALHMLNLWLAHDILHIRQIIHLQWQLLGKDYDLRYSGDW